jgi:hypothetical protein
VSARPLVPGWYAAKCKAQQRAVWRGQLTERESARELQFWHAVMLAVGAAEKFPDPDITRFQPPDEDWGAPLAAVL